MEHIIISADTSKLQIEVIHTFLSKNSYWAEGIDRDTVERSIKGSVCFGMYDASQEPWRQIGFARVITDKTTFAYLADVFVLPEYRGRGLSKSLMKEVMAHPDLQGLRRWVLVTRDAHGLYEQFGFTPLPMPERYMQLHNPAVYAAR